MAEVDPIALQKFYQEELKFIPGGTVCVYLQCDTHTFTDVQVLRVLVHSPTVKLLVIETLKEKLIFQTWSGISIKAQGASNLQLSQ